MLAAQAAGAQVKLLGFPLDQNGDRVDVGRPAAQGVTLGMADGMADHGPLATNIALQRFISLNYCFPEKYAYNTTIA